MPIKDILVHVDSTEASRARLKLALDLARRFEAHVYGFHVVPEPTVRPYVAPSAIGVAVGAYRHHAEHAVSRSRALFEEETAGGPGTTNWQFVEGDVADRLAERARLVDLLVLGQFDEENAKGFSTYLLIEKVVAQSASPVLIVPHIGDFHVLGGRVAVAWDGSRPAARALRDALPFLREASEVHVLVSDIGPGPGDIRGPELVLHLARHGVRAKLSHLQARRGSIANVLLTAVAELRADLLVMGAYGQAPMKEFLLGGVADDVLRQTPAPILASH
jgi:nucleotide-binding universal stress UspA family protein